MKSSVFENEMWDFDGFVDDDFMLVNFVFQLELVEDFLNLLLQEVMYVIEKVIQEMMEVEFQQWEKMLEEY